METIFETKNGVKLYLYDGVYYTKDVDAIKRALLEDILNFPFDLIGAIMARNLYIDIIDNIREIE